MLIAAARGMLDWLAGLGSRPAIRAAIPLYLRERGTTIHALAAVTGGDALRAGRPIPTASRCASSRRSGARPPTAATGC